MNTVTITGNVVADPKLRFLDSGTATASFSVAVSRRYKKGEEWVENTSFFDVTAWNKLAEGVAETLSKGERVIVTGRLEQRSWTNDAGEKRNAVEVIADDIAKSVLFAAAGNTAPRTDASYSSEPF